MGKIVLLLVEEGMELPGGGKCVVGLGDAGGGGVLIFAYCRFLSCHFFCHCKFLLRISHNYMQVMEVIETK
jgi:hypothetical protein